MLADKLSGTPFPLRNLGRAFFALSLPLAFSSCAPIKGALAGTVGGVPYVDEVRHGEAQPGAIHSELKVLGHDLLVVCFAYAIWPVAVGYAGASAIYGAYQFLQVDVDKVAEEQKVKVDSYASPTPLGDYKPAETK